MIYQIEIGPVPIVDQNTYADSYTKAQVDKPYCAINNEI